MISAKSIGLPFIKPELPTENMKDIGIGIGTCSISNCPLRGEGGGIDAIGADRRCCCMQTSRVLSLGHWTYYATISWNAANVQQGPNLFPAFLTIHSSTSVRIAQVFGSAQASVSPFTMR